LCCILDSLHEKNYLVVVDLSNIQSFPKIVLYVVCSLIDSKFNFRLRRLDHVCATVVLDIRHIKQIPTMQLYSKHWSNESFGRKKRINCWVPNIAILSSGDETLSQAYTICNTQYIYNQHLIISKLDVIQTVFNSYPSHLQFLYFVLSHLQTLFRSFTLTIFIPLFHTCNLYFIHTMHHNTLSNLLWIVGSWTYILYTDELNQWPEAYDTWQQIKLLNGVSLYSCCNMESQRFCIT
jgi:hypothetical protein